MDILDGMRLFSLLFALIALAVLAMLVIYLVRGPVDPLIATGLFISFLSCAVPALFLLKPFESREDFQRRKEARDRRRKGSRNSEDQGS